MIQLGVSGGASCIWQDSYVIFSLLYKKSGSLVHIGYQAVQISFEMVYLSIILKSFEKKFSL